MVSRRVGHGGETLGGRLLSLNAAFPVPLPSRHPPPLVAHPENPPAGPSFRPRPDRLRRRAGRLGVWARACSGNRCPSIAGLDSYDPDQASKVYAADGRLITDLGQGAPDRRRPEGDVAGAGGRLPRHRGQAVLPAPRHRLGPLLRRGQGQHPGRRRQRRLLDHHHAAGPKSLSRGPQPSGALPRPEAPRSPGGHRDRGAVPQGQDPRAVPEPDRPRQPGVRRRGGVAALFRQVARATSTWPRPQPWPPSRSRPAATTRAGTRRAPSSAATSSST